MEPSVQGRYLRQLACTVLATCAVTALVNRAVNPYGLFATDWLHAVDKPETFTHLRMVKAAQTRHLKPKALILGSSRAETGLDPAHPGWTAHPVYNLGLSNASIYEVRRYLEHACAVGEVRQVVVLLDFTSFLAGGTVAPDFLEERLAIRPDGSPGASGVWCDLPAGLLTWSALEGSLATLRGREGEKRYLPDGSRDAASEDSRVLSKGGAIRAFAAYEAKVLGGQVDHNARLGDTEFGHLAAILRLARARDIDLRLALSPMHVRYLTILELQGRWQMYQDWKRALLRLVTEEAGGKTPFPLLDFGVCTPQTTDPVPAAGLARYYYEASHFNKVLGKQLLDITLGWQTDAGSAKPPGDFGHALAAGTLDAHIRAVDQAFRNYQKTHVEEMARLKSMLVQASPASP
ncbi:MAG: hypothetical protein CJBNEKGG_02173 [Prosthecobacter sp.]|nr:hypothetical protein [Prosthecobacter sp.]